MILYCSKLIVYKSPGDILLLLYNARRILTDNSRIEEFSSYDFSGTVICQHVRLKAKNVEAALSISERALPAWRSIPRVANRAAVWFPRRTRVTSRASPTPFSSRAVRSAARSPSRTSTSSSTPSPPLVAPPTPAVGAPACARDYCACCERRARANRSGCCVSCCATCVSASARRACWTPSTKTLRCCSTSTSACRRSGDQRWRSIRLYQFQSRCDYRQLFFFLIRLLFFHSFFQFQRLQRRFLKQSFNSNSIFRSNSAQHSDRLACIGWHVGCRLATLVLRFAGLHDFT